MSPRAVLPQVVAIGRARDAVDRAQTDLAAAVTAAIRAGASWEEVGRVLGVTPYAAWKRFVPKGAPRKRAPRRSTAAQPAE